MERNASGRTGQARETDKGSDARLTPAEVEKLYDRLSPVYDLWGRLAESRARRRALELAQIRDGMSVLEVAVGTGLAFTEIVRRNPKGRNAGIDISSGMLARARRSLAKQGQANFELQVASGFDIPYTSECFDVLVNNYMFDLIPFDEMDRILEEFKRVLKPGGSLVLANMAMAGSFLARFYEAVYRLSPSLMGGCRGVRMSEPLVKLGFQVLTSEYMEQLAFPSEVILARKPP